MMCVMNEEEMQKGVAMSDGKRLQRAAMNGEKKLKRVVLSGETMLKRSPISSSAHFQNDVWKRLMLAFGYLYTLCRRML